MNIKRLLSAAAAALVLLSATPAAALSPPAEAAGAKSRVSVHDPSIFKDKDGTYYVFGSHIDAAKSNDLQNWKIFSNGYTPTNNVEFGDLSQNLAKAFAWAGEDLEDCENGYAVWAPDVIYNPDYVNTDGSKGAYMMYFCTSSTYMRSVIAYAVSQNVEGPYNFVDTLIYSGFTEGDSWVSSRTKRVNKKYTSTNIDELIGAGKVTYNSAWFSNGDYNNDTFPNAIDPTIYYDTDGKMYMCYGSWSGGIFTLEIDKSTGQCIHPASGKTSDGRLVDSYFGTLISGGRKRSGEGPYIRYNPETGFYYLWVTYGGLLSNDGYNMRVFRSKSPTGPFTDPAGRQAVVERLADSELLGLKIMDSHIFSSYKTAYMACGHNSVLCDDDGKWYLVNHTRFDDGTEYHEVRVHSMYFNSDGWPVVAPFEYSGDAMSDGGYEESDIVGEYEFIDHGIGTDKLIHNSVKISLNTDGTISNVTPNAVDQHATWEQDKDSSAVTLNINGQRYRGYFMAIQDESGSGARYMTFTAAGSNNQTVWGAKTSPFSGLDRIPSDDYTNHDSQLVYAPDTVGDTAGLRTVSGTKLLSGQTYFITNQYSGLLLETDRGLTDDGTNIQQWDKNKGPHNEWRLVAVDDEYCRIISASDESKCVTVDGTNGDNALNVVLSTYTGADNQLWKIVDQGLNYGIVSKCSGGMAGLDVYDWSKDNGGNVNQWEFWGGECQLWQIVPVCPEVNDGYYTVRSSDSGEYITAKGSAVYLSDGSGWKSENNMKGWRFEKLANGNYSIRTVSGDALTAYKSNDAVYFPIKEKYIGDEAQQFTLKCGKNGAYSITSAAYSNMSIGIGTDGAVLLEDNSGGTGVHQFVLEPIQFESAPLIGDVNADGEFTIADAVMLQNYLLGNGGLAFPESADLCADGVIDTFDFVEMRRLIVNGK